MWIVMRNVSLNYDSVDGKKKKNVWFGFKTKINQLHNELKVRFMNFDHFSKTFSIN